MVTFNEFLIQFNEEVEETFEQVEMDDNAKIAVVTVMKDYLGKRKYDPLELMQLFERACYHAMGKEMENYNELQESVRRQAPTYLTELSEYTNFPERVFEEYEKPRSR